MNYQQEYKRLRAKHLTVKAAREAARINTVFEKAEQKNLARFNIVPDETVYDDSYIDTWTDKTEEERAQEKKELWARIERDGVWVIYTEKHVHCKHCNTWRWQATDSCGGFVGDDWKDSGYDTDCKLMTLKALGLWKD